MPPELWTIGHSNRPLEAFIGLLLGYRIECLGDIRTIPKSRHNPQFNDQELSANLKTTGIRYVHLKALGGLRRPQSDSPNMAWKNSGFRGYADYMQTTAFDAAVGQLSGLAIRQRTAVMCAEAVPWRCHRSLLSDALVAKRWNVFHIMSRVSAQRHRLTEWAIVSNGEKLTYPANSRQLNLL